MALALSRPLPHWALLFIALVVVIVAVALLLLLA
ncbi:hypothetical protein ACVWVY_008019 [Bradyrhizobium sp. URHC0002]